MIPNAYTPTQQSILNVLADGRPHSRDELIGCLEDDFANRKNLNVHLANLRARIRPVGRDIVCELVNRRICYRHVMLISNGSE